MTIHNNHTHDRPMENGICLVNADDLFVTWERRTGPDNIRRNWQAEGIDNVLDVGWLRDNISDFDDGALISLFVDLTSFSGGTNFNEQIDIVIAARPNDWWV
jgi:hypothetical protein